MVSVVHIKYRVREVVTASESQTHTHHSMLTRAAFATMPVTTSGFFRKCCPLLLSAIGPLARTRCLDFAVFGMVPAVYVYECCVPCHKCHKSCDFCLVGGLACLGQRLHQPFPSSLRLAEHREQQNTHTSHRAAPNCRHHASIRRP